MSLTTIECWSGRRLFFLLIAVACLQFVTFIVFALSAPKPYSAEQVIGTKCLRLIGQKNELSIPRMRQDSYGNFVSYNCKSSFDSEFEDTRSRNVSTVFAFQIPPVRDNVQLDYSRWMYKLLVMIMPEFHLKSEVSSQVKSIDRQMNEPHVRFAIQLAGKNRVDLQWTVMINASDQRRQIKCAWPNKSPFESEYRVDCDPVDLFELQSIAFDQYLINLQPNQIGPTDRVRMSELNLIAVNQNGGFTRIWLTFKTVFTCVSGSTLIWFVRRLRFSKRKVSFLEQNLILLATSMVTLNVPIEFVFVWLSLNGNEFVNDIRQGLFQCNLFAFLLIFCGEHQFHLSSRSKWSAYRKELVCLLFCFSIAFLANAIDRGVRVFNPLRLFWEAADTLGLLYRTLELIVAGVYIAIILIRSRNVCVHLNKRQPIHSRQSQNRQLVYVHLLYRFRFLLMFTVFCVLSTLVAIFISAYQSNLIDGENFQIWFVPRGLHWSSALQFSVYSLWNVYVTLVLLLFAPSRPNVSKAKSVVDSNVIEIDQINSNLTRQSPNPSELTVSNIHPDLVQSANPLNVLFAQLAFKKSIE